MGSKTRNLSYSMGAKSAKKKEKKKKKKRGNSFPHLKQVHGFECMHIKRRKIKGIKIF